MDLFETKRISTTGAGSQPVAFAALVRICQVHHLDRVEPLFVDLTRVSELLLGRGDADRVQVINPALIYLVQDDVCMSGHHARIHRTLDDEGGFELEDQRSTNGCRVNGRRVQSQRLRHGDIIETGQTFWKYYQRPCDDVERLLQQTHGGGPIRPTSTFSLELIGELGQLPRIAGSDIPVIIQGESGTGKEVVAGELHRLSGRSGRFVALNCAAIPEGLVESELFGHRKGAFTGAVADKAGMVELADGGTLLLDEIGDMPLPAQAKLLRVLQEGTFARVGDPALRRVNVRFVAATHRRLRQMVEEETFRGDLFARLSGFTLRLPALRQRKEDIGLLLSLFLAQRDAFGGGEPPLELKVVRAFLAYGWPFNIRELKQAVETSLTLAGGGPVQLGDLPRAVREALETSGNDLSPPEPRAESWGDAGEAEPVPLGSVEAEAGRGIQPVPSRPQRRRLSDEELREMVTAALRSHQGNVSAVARELTTTRMQVHRWMKRLGLDPNTFRP